MYKTTRWGMLCGLLLHLLHLGLVGEARAQDTTATKDYIRRAPERELLTSDRIPLVAQWTTRSSDRGFALFRRHAARINAVMDSAGYAERLIDAVITKEEVTPYLRSTEPLPDWDAIARAIAEKYDAATAERIVTAAKAQRWEERQRRNAPRLDGFALNNKAWHLFKTSDDPEELRAATAWMAEVVQQPEDARIAANLDTYANLLYKVGRVAEAITWEEKALKLAREANNSEEAAIYQAILDQMKKGEPTWPQR